jgi:hypothetical protein
MAPIDRIGSLPAHLEAEIPAGFHLVPSSVLPIIRRPIPRPIVPQSRYSERRYATLAHPISRSGSDDALRRRLPKPVYSPAQLRAPGNGRSTARRCRAIRSVPRPRCRSACRWWSAAWLHAPAYRNRMEPTLRSSAVGSRTTGPNPSLSHLSGNHQSISSVGAHLFTDVVAGVLAIANDSYSNSAA